MTNLFGTKISTNGEVGQDKGGGESENNGYADREFQMIQGIQGTMIEGSQEEDKGRFGKNSKRLEKKKWSKSGIVSKKCVQEGRYRSLR